MNISNSKTPKGTIDLYDYDLLKLNYYSNYLKNLFVQNNGIQLETPVFEVRENLLGKYGEEAETKLVYNLEENGSEQAEKYTLRYDLTVPKVRFVVGSGIKKARIYSIGKVYRRDNPALGRFREFYQADFDIFGENSDSMINEVLIFKMVRDFMNFASKSNYQILINDTANLESILLTNLSIDKSKFKSICSTIDKLDKTPFDDLIKEFEQKGLGLEQISKLKEMINSTQPINLESTSRINKILNLCEELGFGDKVRFCASLARGLDYYNGIIFEVKLLEQDFSSSVISGGRYDGMVSNTISSIGISFGLSRLMTLLDYKPEDFESKYFITNLDPMDLETKFKWIRIIEDKLKVNLIFSPEESNRKLVKVINDCISDKIRYLIILASRELEEGKIIIKDLKNKTQEFIELK